MLLCSSFLLSFVITCLFGVLCESCVFVCSFSYMSHVWLCFIFLHVCMNLMCLFLQTLCGCVLMWVMYDYLCLWHKTLILEWPICIWT